MGKLIKRIFNGTFSGEAVPFGAMIIHATENESPSELQISLDFIGNGQKVSVSNGGYFSETYAGLDSPDTRLTSFVLSGTSAKTLFFKNGTYDIYVTGKYGGLSSFSTKTTSSSSDSIFSLDVSEFRYNNDLTTFVALGQNSFTGDAEHIVKKGLSIVNIAGSNINAKMNDFAECTSITLLALPSVADKDEIMDFVTTQVQLGRTSCNDMNVTYLKDFAVFRGVDLSYSSSAASLSWNTTSKIIVGMGHRKLASASKIYAYGASAEEIAAWEAAGKTVVVVN